MCTQPIAEVSIVRFFSVILIHLLNAFKEHRYQSAGFTSLIEHFHDVFVVGFCRRHLAVAKLLAHDGRQ